jgi:hypothetical protein
MGHIARRWSIVVVLALIVTLCLSAATGTASATTVNTVQSAFMGVLYQQEYPDVGDDGTWYFTDWVAYSYCYRANGPDGARFLGYLVACLDVVWPQKGDNTHSGEVAWLREDPGGFWDPALSFPANLAGHDLLWTGTWTGYTLNKRLHKLDIVLRGAAGSVNEGYTADFKVVSGNFDQANWHSGNYVGTPWNGLAYVTAP